jgi:UDP-glucuronate 4-epimerase
MFTVLIIVPDMAHHLFAKAFSENEPIVKNGDGTTKRDFTYVDDIVKGILLAINNPFKYEIINLGNNNPITLNEMIDHFAKHFGKMVTNHSKTSPNWRR